ncbi:MAG TPA: sugar nucleotide-binding protein, partial [bacterium]|nr:sugar nucleotide-binding protein [bacterium]
QGMIGWLKGCLDKGEPVTLFTDEYRTPIYLPDLIAIVDEALRKDLQGVYHVASHPRISRYDLGVLFAEVFGYDRNLIVPGSLKDYEGAKRPPDVSLNTRKLLDKLDYRPLGVEEAIKHLKEEFDGKPSDSSLQKRRSDLYWGGPDRLPER